MADKYCDHSLSSTEINRFSRQLIVEEIGVEGQNRLKQSSALIIGLGGLGCPVALYLAAAGLGRIGLVDYDQVSIENLHRQILHSESSIGEEKTKSARDALQKMNSSIEIETHCIQLKSTNALEIVGKYDIVVDCSDNAPTRYLVNDACVIADKPLVSGSALRWEGQLTVYHYGQDCPCYRCLFPDPPDPQFTTNCAEGGIVGPVVGLIGSLQALESIKIMAGIGSNFAGSLFLFHGLSGQTRSIRLRKRNRTCSVCSQSPTIRELIDYEQFCATQAQDKTQPIQILTSDERISVENFIQRRQLENITLIDTRPKLEFAICRLPEAINIPLEEMRGLSWEEIQNCCNRSISNEVFVVCHRGNDSQLAVRLLKAKSGNSLVVIRDLIGGLDSFSSVCFQFPRY